MGPDEAREFVKEHPWAILATYNEDGTVQMSPVLVGIDAEGRAIISTRETAYKTKNLRRDRRAVICGITRRFFGEWVVIRGSAEVVSLPEAMELLVDYFRRLSGEHDDWDEYREAMRRQQRVLVRIDIEDVGPTAKG